MRHAAAFALLCLALALRAAGTPTITQHLIRRQEQKDDSKETPKSAETRTQTDKDDKHSAKHGSTSATAASVARPSATVDTKSKGKVNVTLASMQYSQSLCTNTSQVLSGSWLNITWIAKGKYSNTVYAKYATDGFNAWTPGMSTTASTEGQRLGNDKKKDDLAADWQMSYQYQVFQHNKAVIFTVIIRDEAVNSTIAMWDTKSISIVGSCPKKQQIQQAKQDDEDEQDVNGEDSETAAASASAGAAVGENQSESQDQASSAEQAAGISAVVACSTGILFFHLIVSRLFFRP